jgi:hypothetical protein
MQIRILSGALALAAVTAACATSHIRTGSAAGDVALAPSATETVPAVLPTAVASAMPSNADVDAAYTGSSMLSMVSRMRILEGRAATIDRTTGLFEDNMILDASYGSASESRWGTVERRSDAASLRKIRIVSTLDNSDTEEFYFDDGRLIMVHWDPQGSSDNNVFEQRGETFYFGDEGLISWVRHDGTSIGASDPAFAYWDKRLRKEARRFAEQQ